MLIRVLLPNEEEGLFNADCSVSLLLDTIKTRHELCREDTVDLSSREGSLKHLNSHLTDNGAAFFKLRELCIVVKVTHECGVALPVYVPALDEFRKDKDIIAALNSSAESHPPSCSGRGKKPNCRTAAHGSGVKHPAPDSGKLKSKSTAATAAAASKGRRRSSLQ